MANILGGLARHVVGDRRHTPRKRRRYDAIVKDEHNRKVFCGWTVNLSSTGAKLRGFPYGTGVYQDQTVSAEFLVTSEDPSAGAKRMPVPAHIVRLDEQNDDFVLALKFHIRFDR